MFYQGGRGLPQGQGRPGAAGCSVRGGDPLPAPGGPGTDQEDGRLHAGVQQAQGLMV